MTGTESFELEKSLIPLFRTLSTLPDYVLYRHAGLVFPGKCTRRHRHKY